MSDIMLLYLFTRLDAIHSLLLVGTILSGAIVFATVLIPAVAIGDGVMEPDSPVHKSMKFWRRVCIALFFVSSVGATLLPTKQDAAIIVGGHLMIEAAKSDVVTETAKKLNELIQGELDSALADLHNKTKKKDK